MTSSRPEFELLLKNLEGSTDSSIEFRLDLDKISELQEYLADQDYYSIVVDDYPEKIVDKSSLIIAMARQGKLNTFNDNWDALRDGLFDKWNEHRDKTGVIFIFKRGWTLKVDIFWEFHLTKEILDEINSKSSSAKLKLLLLNADDLLDK
jgi:hypothetical protein